MNQRVVVIVILTGIIMNIHDLLSHFFFVGLVRIKPIPGLHFPRGFSMERNRVEKSFFCEEIFIFLRY